MNSQDKLDKFEKAKEIRNRYYREWRAKNREKVRQYSITYWLKQAEKAMQQDN